MTQVNGARQRHYCDPGCPHNPFPPKRWGPLTQWTSEIKEKPTVPVQRATIVMLGALGTAKGTTKSRGTKSNNMGAGPTPQTEAAKGESASCQKTNKQTKNNNKNKPRGSASKIPKLVLKRHLMETRRKDSISKLESLFSR